MPTELAEHLVFLALSEPMKPPALAVGRSHSRIFRSTKEPFRGGKWALNGDAPWAPRMPRLRAPWPRKRPGARCAVHRHGGRQPPLSHAMMAAKVDNAEPERVRRTGHGGRGQPSRGQGAGLEGGPEPGGHGAAPAGHTRAGAGGWAVPAVPPLPEAFTTALSRRVAQRVARDDGARQPLVGHICERCLDAPALLVQPAPWGGKMGVCAACQQETPAGDAAPQAR